MSAASALQRPASADPLAGLTDAQREAACAPGPLLVVAGPGAGKTRTLVARLARLLATEGVAPESLLAVTFTRKAAQELRMRLVAAVGERAAAVNVGTFHQLCLRLRPLPEGVRLLSGAEQRTLAEQALRAVAQAGLAVPTNLDAAAERLQSELSLAKGQGPQFLELLAASDLPWLPAAAREYEAQARALAVEDLDDLLLRALAAVEEGRGPELRHLAVDEYQDVNGVQRALLVALGRRAANQVFAIGDPDQAIYAFRGSEVAHFLAFRDDFPGARLVRLADNFRSTAVIVDGAAALIARNSDRIADLGITARAAQTGGERILRISERSARSEAIAIVREIERLIGGTSLTSHDQKRAAAWAAGRYGFSDIAVLTRTVARADRVAEALATEGVPVKRPRRAHLDSAAARDLDAYLDWLADPARPLPRLRVLLAEARRIRASGAIIELEVALLATLAELHQELDGGSEGERLDRVARRLESPSPAVEAVAAARAQNARADLGHESDEWDARFEKVAVLTLHGAKGLEFPVVFLAGCEASLLPGPQALGAGGEARRCEERRLFYVGMTRARELLYLCDAAAGPNAEGGARPSPFVSELPPDLVLQPTTAPRRPPKPQLRLF